MPDFESLKQMIIGGAPVSETWAEEVGGDGCRANASMAMETAKDLMGVTL